MTTAQIIDLHRIRLPDGTHVSRALPSRRQRLVDSLNGLQSPVAVHSPVLDGSAETAAGAIDDNRFCALAAGAAKANSCSAPVPAAACC